MVALFAGSYFQMFHVYKFIRTTYGHPLLFRCRHDFLLHQLSHRHISDLNSFQLSYLYSAYWSMNPPPPQQWRKYRPSYFVGDKKPEWERPKNLKWRDYEATVCIVRIITVYFIFSLVFWGKAGVWKGVIPLRGYPLYKVNCLGAKSIFEGFSSKSS